MITCDEALELLSAALDASLSAAEQETLETHLAQCEACRALQADFSAIHAGMADWQTVPPPATLTDRIMAEVHASKITPLPRAKRWRSWAGLAAVCAVALLGAGPLRMWLSPDSLMDHATGGAAPASQMEQFSAIPAASPEGDAQLQLEVTSGTTPAVPEVGPITVEPSLSNHFKVRTDAPVESASAPAEALGATEAGVAQPQDTSPLVPTDMDGVAVPTSTTPQASSPPLLSAPRMAAMPTYCGSLTLPYEDAPDLSAYPATAMGTEWYYTLPATDFFLLAESYQARNTAVLDTGEEDFSPDAPDGIVILTGVPEGTP